MGSDASEPQAEVVPRRPVVVAGLPLEPEVRERLGQLLGATVVDVRDVVDRADLVLTPSSSPQLIGALKQRYGDVPVVVVELSDWEFDIDLDGPVKRLLASGADGYVTADSLHELAAKLAPPRAPSPSTASVAHELPTPSVDDLLSIVFERVEQAAAQPRDQDDL